MPQKNTKLTKTTAHARVSTSKGGTTELNLKAHVPMSQASSSVTVKVSSGSAYAKVSAQEPGKRKTTTPTKFQQYLMLPPGGATSSRKGSSKKDIK